MKKKVVIILLTILAVILTGVVYAVNNKEYTEKDIGKYLKENHSEVNINNDNDYSSFKILDKDVKKAEVVFIGEAHGVSAKNDIQLKLMKYLNENFGYNYMLLECGYSKSLLINKYLETGDIQYLKESIEINKGQSYYTEQYYDMFIDIYEYNKTHKSKIKTFGIDKEFVPLYAYNYMIEALQDKEITEDIDKCFSDFIYCINNLEEYRKDNSEKEFLNLQKSVLQILNDKKDFYSEFLGEDYFNFTYLLDNLIFTYNYYRGSEPVDRDANMYDNFKKLKAHLPEGKFMGSFGGFHILQNNSFGKSVAHYLQFTEDSPVKGKVISIDSLHDNCVHMERASDSEERKYEYIVLTEKYNDIFKPYLNSKATIFKLNGKRSPFGKKLIYIGEHKSNMINTEKEENNLRYYQYVLILKDIDKKLVPFTEK